MSKSTDRPISLRAAALRYGAAWRAWEDHWQCGTPEDARRLWDEF